MPEQGRFYRIIIRMIIRMFCGGLVPMRWTHKILDDARLPCGHFEAMICHNEQQVEFTGLSGGFSRVRKHIAVDTLWPLAVLKLIRIDTKQRRGFGRRGLIAFHDQAVERGARVAFATVSWSNFDERNWKLKFYESAGWVVIPMELNKADTYIYRPLKHPNALIF